jgi:hypothetical protein
MGPSEKTAADLLFQSLRLVDFSRVQEPGSRRYHFLTLFVVAQIISDGKEIVQ